MAPELSCRRSQTVHFQVLGNSGGNHARSSGTSYGRPLAAKHLSWRPWDKLSSRIPAASIFPEIPFLRELETTMTTAPRGDRWYALQLRTRWENSTATLLSGKGYEVFLPTFKTLKPGHGRRVAVEGPLFPGYVFCRFDACNRLPILVTPGVIAVVGRGRVPIPVEDSEIGAIQRAVSAGSDVEPCPYPDVGQLVRIEEGALTGVEGILTRFKGTHRIILSVSLLRRSVAVEIDRSAIGPVQLTRAAEERDVTDSADPRTDRQPNHGILSFV